MQPRGLPSPIDFSRIKLKSSFSLVLITLVFSLFFSIYQTQTCATYQYSYTSSLINLCINCPLACETCSSSLVCLTCYSSATVVATLSSKKCYCQNGKYYDPKLVVCDACNKVIPNCNKCSTGLSSSVCLTCNNGFYLQSPTSCAACPPKCKTCSKATICLSCLYGQYQLVNGDCVCDTKCSTCLTIHTECIDCSNKDCKNCGVGFEQKNNICIPCNLGCLKCTRNLDCNQCFAGYYLDNNACQPCSILGDLYCTQCQKNQCTVCTVGYRLNMATLKCEPDVVVTCQPTQILIDTQCILCQVIFDPFCVNCNSSGCITCQTGYMIDTNTNACMKIPVCSDGDWVIGYENCDDANAVNGDGCSATCQVETDYECLEADKLQTGQSFCKYTKEFVVNLMYVQKQESANVGLFFFKFQQSTFQLWTDTQLMKFFSPIEIFDANTGTGNIIPYNSLVISFSVVDGEMLFVLTINYGQQNIENAYIKFSMDPSKTALAQINTKSAQPAVFHFIDSRTNGVNLYNYGTSIYDMQKIIYMLSSVLGYSSFVLMLCGLVSPVGKLIVVEALVVIQLGFFTVLQFEKIPPTFIGFKNLLLSSGINDIDLVTSVEGQYQQIPYKTMGLDPNILVNYNITFVVFFIIPFFIGLIGFLITKFTRTKLPNYRDNKESLLSDAEKKRLKDIDTNNHFTDNLRDSVFQRIIFEVSFYGLITTGYLAWVSIFNSLKSPNAINIFSFILIFIIWAVYGVLYLKIYTQQLYLPQHYVSTFQHKNTVILKGFGDFRDVYQQISKNNFYYSYAVQKVYISLILQRIIIPILIVFVSESFAYISIVIAAVYLLFLIVLISSHRKYQNKKIESERKSVFSYLHRNYVLRQSFNFFTTIAVQIIYFIQAIKIQDTGSFVDTLSTNYLTTEIFPLLIITFLCINFLVNVFLWIWELKQTQIVRKTLEIKKFFFSQKDFKPYNYNLDDKKKKKTAHLSLTQKKKYLQKDGNINKQIDNEDEDKQIQRKMKSYFQKSRNLNPNKSPFSGYTQRQQKIDTPDTQILNNNSARKINTQIPIISEKNQKKKVPQDGV